MFKKNIYKHTPNAWVWCAPAIFNGCMIFLSILDQGFTPTHIIGVICVLIFTIIAFLAIAYCLPTIVIDKNENKIKFIHKQFTENKHTPIPLNNISHFEITTKSIKADKNKIFAMKLATTAITYSSRHLDPNLSTRQPHLEAVYKTGKKALVTVNPDLPIVNALKKDYEIKFATKREKLEYYSCQRIYFVIKLLLLILVIVTIKYTFNDFK